MILCDVECQYTVDETHYRVRFTFDPGRVVTPSACSLVFSTVKLKNRFLDLGIDGLEVVNDGLLSRSFQTNDDECSSDMSPTTWCVIFVRYL